MSNLLEVFRPESELFWMTVWRPEDQRPLGELHGIEVQREKDNLGKRLRAVGLGEARVIRHSGASAPNAMIAASQIF
jgi:hypothetical protein